MPVANQSHVGCAERPLHVLVGQIERRSHERLRVELPLIARLSEEDLAFHARSHPDLFPRLHFAMCLLRDAVLTYFDNEQALLFPSVRLIEDGVRRTALDLRRLVPELTAEQLHIRTVLTSIRTLTHTYRAAPVSPLLNMLIVTLRRIDRDLQWQFDVEQHDLFPRAMRLQDSRSTSLRSA